MAFHSTPSPLLFLSNKFCVYIDLQISIGAITFIFVFVVMSLSVVTTQIRDCNLSRHSSELYIQRIGTQIQCASCVLLQATSCFILVTFFHVCLLCFFHSMFMLDGVLHPDWKLISTSPFPFLVCTLTHTFLEQWTNRFSHSVVWFDVISFLDYNDDV